MLFQRPGQVTALIYGKLGSAKSPLMVRATPLRGIPFSRERQRLNTHDTSEHPECAGCPHLQALGPACEILRIFPSEEGLQASDNVAKL